MVRGFMRLHNYGRNRFPRTLLKRVQRDETGLIKGIKGYSYYPAGPRARLRLRRLRLAYKKHLALPQPENQNHEWTCLVHAAVASLEARLRIDRWRFDHRDMLPRLSVQHAIDATAPLRNWNDYDDDDEEEARSTNWDAVYNVLGAGDYVQNVFGLVQDQIGITTAEIWPYRAEGVHAVLPLPRDVDWPKFRMRGLVRVANRNYDGKDEDCINALIRCLKHDGPFVGWCKMRRSHNPMEIMKRKGEVIRDGKGDPCVHSIVITGYKMWRSRRSGEMRGYWEFLNDLGLEWGRDGFGRIAFDAVDGVELPVV